MQNPSLYLALAALLISIGSGLYFLGWWYLTGKKYRFLLYWAWGLGTLLLFKLPNILINAEVEIIQEDLYPYFFVTLLLYFLAYFALIRGFAFFAGSSNIDRIAKWFTFGFILAVLYFAASFFIPGIGVKNAPVWAAHLLFYIPAQVLLLREIWKAARQPVRPKAISSPGLVLTAAGLICLTITSIIYITAQIGPYPAEFWYLSVVFSPDISLWQVASGILLFLGLASFGRSYIKNNPAG